MLRVAASPAGLRAPLARRGPSPCGPCEPRAGCTSACSPCPATGPPVRRRRPDDRLARRRGPRRAVRRVGRGRPRTASASRRSSRTLLAGLGPQEPRRVVVEAAPREHVGLGTGTQLALAVARVLTASWGRRDPVADLAALVKRGLRSAPGRPRLRARRVPRRGRQGAGPGAVAAGGPPGVPRGVARRDGRPAGRGRGPRRGGEGRLRRPRRAARRERSALPARAARRPAGAGRRRFRRPSARRSTSSTPAPGTCSPRSRAAPTRGTPCATPSAELRRLGRRRGGTEFVGAGRVRLRPRRGRGRTTSRIGSARGRATPMRPVWVVAAAIAGRAWTVRGRPDRLTGYRCIAQLTLKGKAPMQQHFLLGTVVPDRPAGPRAAFADEPAPEPVVKEAKDFIPTRKYAPARGDECRHPRERRTGCHGPRRAGRPARRDGLQRG